MNYIPVRLYMLHQNGMLNVYVEFWAFMWNTADENAKEDASVRVVAHRTYWHPDDDKKKY